jgi:hypothetical protein
MALEQGAGVLEVLLGVGLGSGDAVEGCVEDGDDAVLFGERWISDGKALNVTFRDKWLSGPRVAVALRKSASNKGTVRYTRQSLA